MDTPTYVSVRCDLGLLIEVRVYGVFIGLLIVRMREVYALVCGAGIVWLKSDNKEIGTDEVV